MFETIVNTVFSLPYLAVGVTIAAILDIAIHYTKVTTRFTLLEIWGCTVFWPVVVFAVIIKFLRYEL